MTQEALRIYECARKEQLTRSEARRIRTRVAEARRNPHTAALRWPFELLQNALDAGPRKGRSSVAICLRCDATKVQFEHDGTPFSSQELAALLSGGSSKEFESEVTTGRFGTGFLVTHVLAESAVLRGILEVPTGCEEFNLRLDRSGDEDAILKNIHACNEAIRSAQPIPNLKSVSSALFTYPIVEDRMLVLGFEALERALPYLYATRQSLGRVLLERNGHSTQIWTAGEVLRHKTEDGYVEYRSLYVESNGVALPERRIFRFMTEEDASASALVLVERTDTGWRIRLPGPEEPRVYREYPLRGSGFLPINFVLDGKFDPDQERSGLLMTDTDRILLQKALSAAIVAVKYAFAQKWVNAHLLARARKPETSFNPTNPEEKQWWIEQLSLFAERLAVLPIVEDASGFWPAITSDDSYADFIIPRLSLKSTETEDETTVERMWSLVEAATHLYPPREEFAIDWTETAKGWHELGLTLSLVTVSTLAESVRNDAQTLDQLHVTGDKQAWLATFLDIVGECWQKRGNDRSVLTGLLPDQNQRLSSPETLRRDDGISARLKNICSQMGLDVRSRLLMGGFNEIAETAQLTHLAFTVEHAVSSTLTEDELINDAIKYLSAQLPEDKDCNQQTNPLEESSARLLHYLWETKGEGAASSARQVPLLTSNRRTVRWSPDRMMMAPVSSWHESARAFANAYPPQRVLAELYCGAVDEDIPNSVEALVHWGIAIADPITVDVPVELKERRLDAISLEDTQGVVVSQEQFSQIALLQPEVLNRCQEGIDEARALLGLVLCHVAPHDPSWDVERTVQGRKAGAHVNIMVRGALWLADLKFRAWVPVAGEDGKAAKMLANAATLKDLLDSTWLQNNDYAIKLLSEQFGFDELELRLLGIAPNAQKRMELRNSLARLVEWGGADPEFYESLKEDMEAQRRQSRDIARCRRLGIAVQEAIKSAIEGYHPQLKLELVDRGFDYKVTQHIASVFEDAAYRCDVGPHLLEIKATRTGGARLTPMQAEKASIEKERYTLCVVDLRGMSEEELDAEWTGTRVEPLAKIVPDIGDKVQETCILVEAATTTSIAIRNESALRYEVPSAVWEAGLSIGDWIAQTFAAT